MTTNELRTLVEGVTRKLLDSIGKSTLDWLKEQGIGVTIFAFTFKPGALAYISTSDRADMIRSLKEWIAYQEAGITTEGRGERGQS